MPWAPDRSKVFASQMSAKERFAGEAGGVRLAHREGHYFVVGESTFIDLQIVTEGIHCVPPKHTSSHQLDELQSRLKRLAVEIREKTSTMVMQDFKRLLFRAAAALISTKGVGFILFCGVFISSIP